MSITLEPWGQTSGEYSRRISSGFRNGNPERTRRQHVPGFATVFVGFALAERFGRHDLRVAGRHHGLFLLIPRWTNGCHAGWRALGQHHLLLWWPVWLLFALPGKLVFGWPPLFAVSGVRWDAGRPCRSAQPHRHFRSRLSNCMDIRQFRSTAAEHSLLLLREIGRA